MGLGDFCVLIDGFIVCVVECLIVGVIGVLLVWKIVVLSIVGVVMDVSDVV